MTVFSELKLPKGFSILETPDHPFTFEGPDFLLSSSKGLIANFILKRYDENNPLKLISKLTNSIIAYPAQTKMVLIVDETNNANAYSKLDKYYFNKIIEIKDLKRANSLIKDSKSSKIVADIKNTQKQLFKIQSLIQNDNLNYIKKHNFDKIDLIKNERLSTKASFFDQLSQKEINVRANIYKYNDIIIGIKKLHPNKSDIGELQPFYEFSANADFTIDHGVPYFTHLSKKALSLNEIPKIKIDPLKPIRLASLFGWYIANTNHITELEQRLPK